MKTQLLAILLVVQGFISSVSYAAVPVVINTGNQTTTLCAGQSYYSVLDNLVIGHDTLTTLTFVNATSSNNGVINASNLSPYISNDNYTQSNVYAQSNIGVVGSLTTVTVHYFFSDGINTIDVPVVYTIKPSPTVVFLNSSYTVCSSEGNVDMSSWVYPVGGSYGTGIPGDGNPLPSSILNVDNYSSDSYEDIYYIYTAANGCSASAGTSVNIYAAAQITMTASDASACGSNDGSLDASIYLESGANYTYVWNDGNTTETDHTGLLPGNYHIDVTDIHGCISEATATVGISGVTITETVDSVSCYGANDGAISLAISGFTPTTIYWSSGQGSQNISNLSPGTYTVYLADASGCNVSKTFSVYQPDYAYSYGYTYPPSSCSAADGSISIMSTYGGNGGYLNSSYSWSNSATGMNVTNLATGIYTLTVTDQKNCIYNQTFVMSDYGAPYVYTNMITPSNCSVDNGSIDLDTVGIGEPVLFAWSNANPTLDLVNAPAGNYSFHIYDANQCDNYYTFVIDPIGPVMQPLCMISVDSATTTNIVVWEKVDAANVSFYNIYRETVNPNEFVVIDTVQNTNLSIFNDVMASPIAQSWRYKISAVDACGVEGPLSPAHKTMHITTIDLGNGDFQAVWNPYYGVDYTNFILYRFTSSTGWVEIATLPSVITSYYDTPPNTSNLDYMVELDLDFTCTADYEKAQDFNTTRSNKDKGNFIVGTGTGVSNNELNENSITMNVYPNPVTSSLTVEISDNGMNKTMYLVTVDGQIIKTTTLHSVSQSIDMSDLSNGLYFLKIEGQNETIPVVKN